MKDNANEFIIYFWLGPTRHTFPAGSMSMNVCMTHSLQWNYLRFWFRKKRFLSYRDRQLLGCYPYMPTGSVLPSITPYSIQILGMTFLHKYLLLYISWTYLKKTLKKYEDLWFQITLNRSLKGSPFPIKNANDQQTLQNFCLRLSDYHKAQRVLWILSIDREIRIR